MSHNPRKLILYQTMSSHPPKEKRPGYGRSGIGRKKKKPDWRFGQHVKKRIRRRRVQNAEGKIVERRYKATSGRREGKMGLLWPEKEVGREASRKAREENRKRRISSASALMGRKERCNYERQRGSTIEGKNFRRALLLCLGKKKLRAGVSQATRNIHSPRHNAV